jgi:predicted RNA binding protein YcfA (HicA-like mRNA interferase family)
VKLPRDVSGTHLAEVLCRRWEYVKVHQVGSHMILETSVPSHQRITIPRHDPIRIGTLNSILRTIAQHKNISREEIINAL